MPTPAWAPLFFRPGPGAPGSLVQFVQRSTVLTYTSSDRLEHTLRGKAASVRYPDNNGLGQRLRLIAQLIKAGATRT